MPTDPEGHKQQVTGLFDLIAEGYDNPSQRFFVYCADRLIERLRPSPGARLLDVATGTGAAATAAAQAVGAHGRVHAIDLSEQMLDRAFANVRKMSLPNVDLHVMDAERLDFKSAYFDYVICAFGLFFVPDMGAALRQWHRVLKPGGTVAFTSFAEGAFQPLAQMLREDLAQIGVETPTPPWYRLTDAAANQALLEAAGFEAIESCTEQHGYHLADENGWWELVWNTGFRGHLAALAPQALAQLRARHLVRVASLIQDDGLWLDVPTLFTTARRPAATA